MTHIQSVTITVVDDNGQTFTIRESSPGPRGDNPRFVGQQFTTAIESATARAFEVIPAYYGAQQAWPPPEPEPGYPGPGTPVDVPPMITTTDIADAAANIAAAFPDLPHSRACGIRNHVHGRDCHENCPSCHGEEEWAVLCDECGHARRFHPKDGGQCSVDGGCECRRSRRVIRSA